MRLGGLLLLLLLLLLTLCGLLLRFRLADVGLARLDILGVCFLFLFCFVLRKRVVVRKACKTKTIFNYYDVLGNFWGGLPQR